MQRSALYFVGFYAAVLFMALPVLHAQTLPLAMPVPGSTAEEVQEFFATTDCFLHADSFTYPLQHCLDQYVKVHNNFSYPLHMDQLTQDIKNTLGIDLGLYYDSADASYFIPHLESYVQDIFIKTQQEFHMDQRIKELARKFMQCELGENVQACDPMDQSLVLSWIVHQYLTDARRRLGWFRVLQEVTKLSFNELELRKLHARYKSATKQFKDGATVGLVGVAVALMSLRSRQAIKALSKVEFKKLFSESIESLRHRFRSKAAKEAIAKRARTFAIKKSVDAGKTGSVKLAAKKIRFLGIVEQLKLAGVLAGVSATGGAAWLGVQSGHKAVKGEYFSLPELLGLSAPPLDNPNTLKANVADVFSVLSLECRSWDLLQEVQGTDFDPERLPELFVKTQKLMLELHILLSVAPGFVEARALPAEIATTTPSSQLPTINLTWPRPDGLAEDKARAWPQDQSETCAALSSKSAPYQTSLTAAGRHLFRVLALLKD